MFYDVYQVIYLAALAKTIALVLSCMFMILAMIYYFSIKREQSIIFVICSALFAIFYLAVPSEDTIKSTVVLIYLDKYIEQNPYSITDPHKAYAQIESAAVNISDIIADIDKMEFYDEKEKDNVKH
jgi:hypothetical protein